MGKVEIGLMKTRFLKRFVLPTVVLSLLLSAACVPWLRARLRQDALDHQLIDALVNKDAAQALLLVNAGADPNAPYDPVSKPSLLGMWNRLLHRSAEPQVEKKPAAFLMACGAPYYHFLSGPYVIWMSGNIISTFNSDPQLVQSMLQHGANLDATDNREETPLFWAISSMNRKKAVAILLEHGANVNARNAYGGTPLMAAADDPNTNPNTIRLLFAHGADVNAKDVTGQTPLMRAALYDGPEIVSLLLEHGADINARDNDGDTPLIIASAYAPAATMRLLLKHGADPNRRGKGDLTALQFAQRNKRPDLVALLRRAGAQR